MSARGLVAQEAGPEFPERVIHLWVDPHYGSDSLTFTNPPGPGAALLNPDCMFTPGGNGCSATECRPMDVATASGALLLHAPWPFKTINGPGGALSYIPALPYLGTQGDWKYAIIHLLPGLYARSDAYGFAGTVNPNNALTPNGEVFPIQLPTRVSIQGTSALNTLFDGGVNPTAPLTTQPTPVFEFGVTTTKGDANGFGTFIDKVSVFGVNREEFDLQNPPGPNSRAAIYLASDLAAAPTISNCFIFANGTGVLVDAATDGTVKHDGLTLIHNTIAFNLVGLWNGQYPPPTGGSTGISRIHLINNIFDSAPDPNLTPPRHWAVWAPTAGSGHEGVDRGDLTLCLNPPSCTSLRDFNAYEGGKYGRGIPFPAVFLPATNVRAGGLGRPTTPGVDIATYTGGMTGNRRGALYIRDAFLNGNFIPAAGSFDKSPHDFRLLPAAALANQTVQMPSVRNPLVDAGWFGSFPVTMGNGLTIATAPGTLTLNSTSQNTWTWTLFDELTEDCEGFGNRRFHDHPKYPNSGVSPTGKPFSDIGADELGELVCAGYRFGTTRLLGLSQALNHLPTTIPLGTVFDNKYLWFFGPPTAIVGAPRSPTAPFFRAVDHLASMPANYIAGSPTSYFPPWFSAWSWGGSPFVATLADTTPYLLDDVHPWWHVGGATGGVPYNPIWQHCGPNYNTLLFVDPTEQVINPTGSYKGNGTTFQWLDQTFTVSSRPPSALAQIFGFHSTVNFRAGWTLLASYDSWCRGWKGGSFPKRDTLKPTFGATGTMTALRYCLENSSAPAFSSTLSATNLQSLLVIVETPGS